MFLLQMFFLIFEILIISAHTVEISSGVAGGIFLVFLVVSLVFYRNWKYEQELDSLLWKVDYKDIQINEDSSSNCQGTKNARVSLYSLY